jgi:hypothetical protein
MEIDGLLKDFGEAYGRLFDHRPIVRGEVNFFLREFEDKRGNRDEIRLRRALELGTELTNNLIPGAIETVSTSLCQINQSLNEISSTCSEILTNENVSEKTSWLEVRHLERTREWTAFVEHMCERCSAVDDEYASEVRRVEQYYRDLEQKLKINQPPDKIA